MSDTRGPFVRPAPTADVRKSGPPEPRSRGGHPDSVIWQSHAIRPAWPGSGARGTAAHSEDARRQNALSVTYACRQSGSAAVSFRNSGLDSGRGHLVTPPVAVTMGSPQRGTSRHRERHGTFAVSAAPLDHGGAIHGCLCPQETVGTLPQRRLSLHCPLRSPGLPLRPRSKAFACRIRYERLTGQRSTGFVSVVGCAASPKADGGMSQPPVRTRPSNRAVGSVIASGSAMATCYWKVARAHVILNSSHSPDAYRAGEGSSCTVLASSGFRCLCGIPASKRRFACDPVRL